jgi:hypothetical protein
MTTMQDPTRDEMLAFVASLPFASERDESDIEEAIYWYASDYHGGQWSNLYAAICESPFTPGPCSNGPEDDGMAAMLYDDLESEFGKAEAEAEADSDE